MMLMIISLFCVLLVIAIIATITITRRRTKVVETSPNEEKEEKNLSSSSSEEVIDSQSESLTESPDSTILMGGNEGVPLLRWEGVREAVDKCYPAGGKFTVSYVPEGVWVGGKVGSYHLTGSYDENGNKIYTEKFGNSNKREYNRLECGDRVTYSGINCSDGIIIDEGVPTIDASGETTCNPEMQTELQWKEEIEAALKWWEDCYINSTGVKVQFEILGEEIPVNDRYIEVGREAISREDMTAHNIGDIRICSFDFSKVGCALQGVLMYNYLHAPCDYRFYNGSSCLNNDYSENGFVGNTFINSSVCWRKDSLDVNYKGGEIANKCGFDQYNFRLVFAHELGHGIGLAHECGNDATQYYPCINNASNSIMMPSVDPYADLPKNCGTWVSSYISDLYCGNFDCPCKKKKNMGRKKVARHDRLGMIMKEEGLRKEPPLHLSAKMDQNPPKAWCILDSGVCDLIDLAEDEI